MNVPNLLFVIVVMLIIPLNRRQRAGDADAAGHAHYERTGLSARSGPWRRRSQRDRSSWPPSSLLRPRCTGPTPSPAAYWCCWRWPAWPPCAEPPADRGVRAPASPLPGARTQIPWRLAADWEHMMSLNYRQRYQLRLVKAGVRRSDPLLCAVFGMFGRLCPGALCYDGGDWRG